MKQTQTNAAPLSLLFAVFLDLAGFSMILPDIQDAARIVRGEGRDYRADGLRLLPDAVDHLAALGADFRPQSGANQFW